MLVRCWISLFCLALLGSCQKKDASLLRMECKPGSSWVQRFRSTKTIQEKGQAVKSTHFREESQYRLECLSQAAESYVMALTYQEQSFLRESDAGQKIQYDSRRQRPEEAPPEALGNALLVGVRVEFRLDQRAQVQEILNLAAIQEQIRQKIRDPRLQAKWQSALESEINAATLQATLRQSFLVLPEKPVGTGDRWEYAEKTERPLQLEELHRLHVDQKESDRWVLTSQTSLASNPRQAIESNGLKLSYDLSGTARGQIVLDAQTGLIRSSERLQESGGSLTIEGPGLPEKGMRVQLEIQTQTSIETET